MPLALRECAEADPQLPVSRDRHASEQVLQWHQCFGKSQEPAGLFPQPCAGNRTCHEGGLEPLPASRDGRLPRQACRDCQPVQGLEPLGSDRLSVQGSGSPLASGGRARKCRALRLRRPCDLRTPVKGAIAAQRRCGRWRRSPLAGRAARRADPMVPTDMVMPGMTGRQQRCATSWLGIAKGQFVRCLY